jgi:hypothetical protein
MAASARKTQRTSKQQAQAAPQRSPKWLPAFSEQPEGYIVTAAGTVILAFVIAIISSASSFDSTEIAHAQGAALGRDDGQRAGEAKGFEVAFDAAEEAAYSATLSELRLSGRTQRPLVYYVIAVVVGLLIGFASQYIVFYVLRRPGFLGDIDWIVLSPEVMDQMRSTSTQEANVVLTEEPLNLPAPKRDK